MKNPVDRVKMDCLVFADRGKFMGIARVKLKIEWLTKNAEDIPIEEVTILRKWVPPPQGDIERITNSGDAPVMKGE
jgi:hypothetical protein